MRRSTIILLVIFFLLGGLVWYMQQEGDNPIKRALATSTIEAVLSQETLVDPNNGPVNQITIQAADGQTVILDRTSAGWQIKTDQVQPADQSKAESAAGQVLDLRIVNKMDAAPDPAGTGLNAPAYTIKLVLANNVPFSFKIGKPTVTGSGYYAEGPDGTIYILSKSEIDNLLQNYSQPPIMEVPNTGTLEPEAPAVP